LPSPCVAAVAAAAASNATPAAVGPAATAVLQPLAVPSAATLAAAAAACRASTAAAAAAAVSSVPTAPGPSDRVALQKTCYRTYVDTCMHTSHRKACSLKVKYVFLFTNRKTYDGVHRDRLGEISAERVAWSPPARIVFNFTMW
jgi:hypothetical protein